ncbi:hypothetical protein TNIN_353321 [Trichonephila inaurata madagascariensis]|uniref:Uncharacterized protein n=1 Tax=Trichonephila inaurata madagascariensis TaxID=2747483 RepID=A0A8X6X4N2_9ARAC|nr:hypothetical protein TNIN_353321 [Trichonephila inaurata madagascariensis]
MVERDEPETQATVAADSASFILITEHSLQAGVENVAEFANRSETKTKTGIRQADYALADRHLPCVQCVAFPIGPADSHSDIKGQDPVIK